MRRSLQPADAARPLAQKRRQRGAQISGRSVAPIDACGIELFDDIAARQRARDVQWMLHRLGRLKG
jgi:hypothetical protein